MKLHELFEAEERTILSVMGKLPDPTRDELDCESKQLTSLEGAPTMVTGYFDCSKNPELKSLKGGPAIVLTNFLCSSNQGLISLEGAPTEIGGDFYCSNNPVLTSLQGAPTKIGGNFICSNNPGLTSLKGIHKQIKEIRGQADFSGASIKSHVLGLMRIKGLGRVVLANKNVQDVINRHLKGERDIFACQEELIEAGFEEYARL